MDAETRACEGLCGSGVSTCSQGYWSECRIPSVETPCSGPCGAGVQTCENGVMGACVIPVMQRECSSVCGSGHESCINGEWGPCDAPLPKPPVLHTKIRDFHAGQADFELPRAPNTIDAGMVERFLGKDHLPVYAGNPTTISTPSGKAGFDLWFHDTPGVNQARDYDLQLSDDPNTPGGFFFEDTTFFPIDGKLFGNEGRDHNYHFTLEAHTAFVYRGGEVFTFAGDDDFWVFVNNGLVIDLGGTHTSRTGRVNIDEVSGGLAMFVGQKYPLDLFFAERHTFSSNFIVHTTIADVGSCE
ncbi:MAG TPA: fibro-slime domain-containing protein [Polyangiaceae bacterium]|nr:fibro-slime domain-containing protein [Polyangiaceae bacterium]